MSNSHMLNIDKLFKWKQGAQESSAFPQVINPEKQPCFIPLRQVTEYLKDTRRLRDILSELFLGLDLPVSTETIQKYYPRIFLILVLIERGQYIERFVEHEELRDEKLPFHTKPENFPEIPDLYQQFYNQQWEFCPYTFVHQANEKIPAHRILPFTQYERCGNGGNASIHRVFLLPDYNKLRPVETTGKNSNLSSQELNTFVVKTYRSRDAEKYYDAEKRAFLKFRRSENLIKFYGSFIYNDTYNLILENANGGSLEDYFQKVTPPSTEEDILAFWKRLLGPVTALLEVHNGGSGDDAAKAPVFQGWHQDVKPTNILVVNFKDETPYSCQFKLGDLGLSHFMKTSSRNETYGSDTSGTRTYGAPECCRPDDDIRNIPLQIKQSVDIWSIGCVYCEAVVWVMLGRGGLEGYRQRRQKETDSRGCGDRGCFHDGTGTLTCALDYPNTILEKKQKRECDTVTEHIFEVVRKALRSDSEARPTAKILRTDILDILTLQQKRTAASRRNTAPVILQNGIQVNGPELPPLTPPGAPGWRPRRQGPELPGPSSASGRNISTRRNAHTRSSGPSCDVSCDTDGRRGFGGMDTSPVNSPTNMSTDSLTSPRPLPDRPTGTQATGGLLRWSMISTSTVGLPRNENLPFLGVSQALHWKADAKNSDPKIVNWISAVLHMKRSSVRPRLQDEWLLTNLKERDLIFLIDDTNSMKNHWGNVDMIFGLLAYMVKDVDPDGIELFFSSAEKGFKGKNTSELSKMLKKRHDKHSTDTSGIRERLNELFKRYLDDYDNGNRPQTGLFPRKPASFKEKGRMTIYVFTDGEWYQDPRVDVENLIMSFIKDLRKRNIKRKRVGIQFITFDVAKGSEKDKFFEKLDWGLSPNRSYDIVDAEPFEKNVWKMLLGSINKLFDDDDDGSLSTYQQQLSLASPHDVPE
ncbi:uncharacterized protein K452DRAFT_320254 [Aplosporella prunicola CBS 121167]|uniref:Protein kinase domain-containing protein n=1 Tax=Aplosporella prunicola CBS 121167 TaxID=1176127 RepID=A0A6A6B654_9PEZI|nr:uncharacterized protein K452DRAFT_320254 [Aplosporella prunicola CBS 121167]KAF2139612.1 hypothetical protein K452DRAFT_320254 [Aplosporella prunicola CBS 121167]